MGEGAKSDFSIGRSVGAFVLAVIVLRIVSGPAALIATAFERHIFNSPLVCQQYSDALIFLSVLLGAIAGAGTARWVCDAAIKAYSRSGLFLAFLAFRVIAAAAIVAIIFINPDYALRSSPTAAVAINTLALTAICEVAGFAIFFKVLR